MSDEPLWIGLFARINEALYEIVDEIKTAQEKIAKYLPG